MIISDFDYFLSIGSLNGVLLGITLAAMSGSLSWDIYLHERGCCDITDACKDRKKYEKTYNELYNHSLEIDAIYNAGKLFHYLKLFCYLSQESSVTENTCF